MPTQKVYVIVDGGVVDTVDVPVSTNGMYAVIDFDNIESDPKREWSQFDPEDRAYIKAKYPEEFAKHFSKFE